MSFSTPGRYTLHPNSNIHHDAILNGADNIDPVTALQEEHHHHMHRELELEKQHRKREEDLINSYEAEEDRIVVMLSRKLEQLRESKTDPESTSKCTQAPVNVTNNVLEVPVSNHNVLEVTRPQDEEQRGQAGPQRSQEEQKHAQGKEREAVEADHTSSIQSSHHPGTLINTSSPMNGYDHSRTSSTGSGLLIPQAESNFSSPDMSLSASPSDTRLGLSCGLGYRGYAGNGPGSSNSRNGWYYPVLPPPPPPSHQQEQMGMMLEAMRRENEQLKSRLADADKDYFRISRLNELYREELIECRGRLGLPVDDLIGLASDPYPQYRSTSSSTGSSPSTSVLHIPTSYAARHNHSSGVSIHHPSAGPALNSHSHYPLLNGSNQHFVNGNGHANGNGSSGTNGVPIPRPSSQVHRPKLPMANTEDCLLSTIESAPSSASESIESPASPFPFSPRSVSTSTSYAYHHPSGSSSAASAASTNVTSPPSSFSLGAMMMMPTLGVPSRGLSYPSVPPPSLSSSYGSTVWDRDVGYSPVEGLSRRNSNAGLSNTTGTGRRGSVSGSARVVETGSLRASRRASGELNSAADGRVRSRAGSLNQGMNLNLTQGHQLPEKVDEAEADDVAEDGSAPN